jgi:uncharacterized radical SAM superfamily Fe-S cluster-containing enzyme
MKYIHDTISLCNTCYRHIPGIVFEKDDKIWITKKCDHHGEQQEIVELDPAYYYNINKKTPWQFVSCMFEATNKCQLACPHCYQMPDNKSVDRPLDLIMNQLIEFPIGVVPMIAGAEPTLYKEIIPLAHTIADRWGSTKILSNGLKFVDKKFTKSLLYNKPVYVSIGLNHWSYQGERIHKQQLEAIQNIKEVSTIDVIAYTVENFDHLPEIFKEIDKLGDDKVKMFRIRFGSFIGRSSDQQRNYLSKTLEEMKKIVGKELVSDPLDDNPYHNMFKWRDNSLRIIQWPDVKNIDMEELITGPWAQFHDGPVTNFVHQVILRDAFINSGFKKLDDCPSYYQFKTNDQINSPEYQYWKKDWKGPVEFEDFDYTINDERKQPVRSCKWLS